MPGDLLQVQCGQGGGPLGDDSLVGKSNKYSFCAGRGRNSCPLHHWAQTSTTGSHLVRDSRQTMAWDDADRSGGQMMTPGVMRRKTESGKIIV